MKDILMPRFDPEMKSGKIVEWLKREGDSVSKGESIALIDTEKVTIEIESPESGVLGKILAQPGEEVPVGTRVGSIIMAGESMESPSPATPVSTTEAIPRREAVTTGESSFEKPSLSAESDRSANWLRASPAARRLASELGVDLKSVQGTGPNGRITQEDVTKQAATKSSAPAAKPMEAEAAPVQQESFTVRKLSTMRTTIGERMVASWTKVPQVPLFVEVDLTQAEKFRTAMEKLISRRVSLTAIITKALASALTHFKHINARYEPDKNEIHEYNDVDVSIAVALEEGLLTPVVRNANRKTATDISHEIEGLAERARSGKLAPSELRGGTTTVSNLGGYLVDSFIPIINPPQVTILGVGRSRDLENGTVVCTLTLVFDHRVTDGAEAARLLQRVKEFIESPYLLQMA